MLIYCKVNLELTWGKKCILASAPGTPATFRIIEAIRFNSHFKKLKFKISKTVKWWIWNSVYWSKYTLISNKEVTLNINDIGNIRKPLDSIFQEVKILFVLACYHSINANGTNANGRVKAYSY